MHRLQSVQPGSSSGFGEHLQVFSVACFYVLEIHNGNLREQVETFHVVATLKLSVPHNLLEDDLTLDFFWILSVSQFLGDILARYKTATKRLSINVECGIDGADAFNAT